MSKNFKTSIGGQALIEGVMMRGPRKTAMSVRKPGGELQTDIWDNKPARIWNKLPIVRGVVNMVTSLVVGYRCLMKSAEISTEGMEEEEPSKLEKWLEEKLGDKLMKGAMVIASVLGVLLAVLLFMYLPAWLVGLGEGVLPHWSMSLIEGLIKIGVFLLYMGLIGLMPDMRRLYQYHGAEHKTIACYEAGEELTPENIRKYPRFHPRCGTSFIVIALILGILIFSVVTWSNALVRTLLKLCLLPIVVGIAYELIKLAGRYDNLFTRIISFPGLKIQHLTTREPDDSMIEAAIASMEAVIPENEGEDRW
ncbi:MAG TPA: DUF1385 domain-containing protein [Candidatus Merdivicinus intestinigallinarum]|nr:DUF1385 domain-containing protein [Candidatus Merdivicinus intestinigallinarum]